MPDHQEHAGYDAYLLGRAAMESGDFEAAVAHLETASTAQPHFKSLELWGECLMRLGRFSAAIIPLAAATALNRGVRAPSLLAEALYEAGDMEAAGEAVALALSRDPRNHKALDIRQALAARQLASK